MSNKQIFTKIYNAIPKDLFLNKDGLFECAISIYLTYCGIRPGCIPFDGEVLYGGISTNEMLDYMYSSKGKKCINTLNNIKNLKVVIGPYYDAGTCIVVYNTSMSKFVEPLLSHIANIRSEMEGAGANGAGDKLVHQIHIPLAKILGYQCPMDLNKIKKGDIYYSIGYNIKNRKHLICWCPYKNKTLIDSAQKLSEIKLALTNIIDDKDTVVLEIEIVSPYV